MLKGVRKHHIACNLPHIADDLTNREICLHHNLSNDEVYASFVRRCNRILNLIDIDHKIVFVYYNRYTNDFDDLVDFCNNVSQKNIYVVGIFENSNETKMLYQSSNCRIFKISIILLYLMK